jgi:TadE-like protein
MNGQKILISNFTRNIFVNLAPSKGQVVVEFTLVFVLLLAISWIPADFGLAFFTGQLVQNASPGGSS